MWGRTFAYDWMGIYWFLYCIVTFFIANGYGSGCTLNAIRYGRVWRHLAAVFSARIFNRNLFILCLYEHTFVYYSLSHALMLLKRCYTRTAVKVWWKCHAIWRVSFTPNNNTHTHHNVHCVGHWCRDVFCSNLLNKCSEKYVYPDHITITYHRFLSNWVSYCIEITDYVQKNNLIHMNNNRLRENWGYVYQSKKLRRIFVRCICIQTVYVHWLVYFDSTTESKQK